MKRIMKGEEEFRDPQRRWICRSMGNRECRLIEPSEGRYRDLVSRYHEEDRSSHLAQSWSALDSRT